MAVLGIGGLFLRARDPDALARWYATHLGVGAGLSAPGARAGDAWSWQARGGPLVFAPMPPDADYFARDRAFMLNFRVEALDAMIAALGEAGIAAETRAEWDSAGAGRFARIHDPEGNPIELWEPPIA